MHSEGHCSCMCVCVSINQDLTSGVSVCSENDITYSTGSEGPKFVWISLKLLCCRDAFSIVWLFVQLAIFETTHVPTSVSEARVFKDSARLAPRVLHFSACNYPLLHRVGICLENIVGSSHFVSFTFGTTICILLTSFTVGKDS